MVPPYGSILRASVVLVVSPVGCRYGGFRPTALTSAAARALIVARRARRRRWTICWIWSTATARMMTAPVITCCQNGDTPTMTRPLARKPMTKAPMIVPRTVPRPPESAAPPMTTAAMAFSS